VCFELFSEDDGWVGQLDVSW